jgi:hypothetical protein
MSTQPLTARYRRQRNDLLGAADRHRRAETPASFSTDIHRSHLDVCRRQLGALRQAFRRTREIARRTSDPRMRARRSGED